MSDPRFLLAVARDSAMLQEQIAQLANATGLTQRSAADHWALLSDAQSLSDGDDRGGEGVRPSASGVAPAERRYHLVHPDSIEIEASATGVTVSRPPTGALGCYWIETGQILLVASDPLTLAATGRWRPTVDWAALGHALYAAGLPSERTCLSGCREVLPGFSLEVKLGAAVELRASWSPWAHVAASHADTDGHATSLEQVILQAVSRALQRHGKLLLGVSGGLDSSILTAAIASTGHPAACFTIATAAPDGDERTHARALARYFGLELIEKRYSLADIDPAKAVCINVPRPVARTHEQSYYRGAAEALDETGSGVLFTGNGGDALFCRTQSGVALADRLLSQGPGRGALQTLRDICRLTGAAAGPVLRNAAGKLGRDHRRYNWRPDRRLLGGETLNELDRGSLEHPWLSPPVEVLPGRAVHVALLLRIQQAIASRHDIAIEHPLMSQTVLEAVLAIPTWRWLAQGIDRFPVREAFAARLPPTILSRKVKGGPDSFAIALIERFRDQIRDRLLAGCLAERGIISRADVEQALRRSDPRERHLHVRLLHLLEAENWAAYWSALQLAG